VGIGRILHDNTVEEPLSLKNPLIFLGTTSFLTISFGVGALKLTSTLFSTQPSSCLANILLIQAYQSQHHGPGSWAHLDLEFEVGYRYTGQDLVVAKTQIE